jgi:two-component system sensor histidine kinase DesK
MSERPGTLLFGRSALSGRPRGGIGYAAAFVWLAFIVFPLINALARRGPTLQHALAVAGALTFIAAYVALVLIWRRHQSDAIPAVLFGVLVAIASALTIGEGAGWGFLFTYCAACAALVSPARFAFFAVAICSALGGGTSAIGGASGGTVIGFVATPAGIGLLMLLLRDLRVRNDELSEARSELARLAVEAERERFARDLHDLLGHTLSVIALKAELAGRLLPGKPGEAAAEMAEVEHVARGALSEVREAVSGYRQPTLEGELDGARMALSAAGIETEIEQPSVVLAPDVEAVLAWAVREGATNVIRHSGASHVTMKVSASLGDAAVEVVDDGAGVQAGAVANGHRATGLGGVAGAAGVGGGHGLAGLAERAESLRGRVETGSGPDGGFRLAVIVPVGSQ